MKPGDRLPATELRDARDGSPVRLREPALGSTVLFVAHGAGCSACHSYLRDLRRLDEACRLWEARRLAVLPGLEVGEEALIDDPEPGGSGPPVRLLADPDGTAVGRVAAPGTAIVADRFGEIFHVAEAAEDHDTELPSPGDLESWLRFIAIQCPECGVPDSAGYGPWGAPRGERGA